jgi:hypothetical protein
MPASGIVGAGPQRASEREGDGDNPRREAAASMFRM